MERGNGRSVLFIALVSIIEPLGGLANVAVPGPMVHSNQIPTTVL